MPIATSGGSLVESSNIVDNTIIEDDINDDTELALEPICLVSFPRPVLLPGTTSDGVIATNNDSNTRCRVAMINVPVKIIANKVSIPISGAPTAGSMKWALFSEDGQTQIFSITTGTITGSGIHTHSFAAPVEIKAGNYYWAMLPVGTASIDTHGYDAQNTQVGLLSRGVTSEPVLNGELTVTASTMPSTINLIGNPALDTTGECPLIRFDN